MFLLLLTTLSFYVSTIKAQNLTKNQFVELYKRTTSTYHEVKITDAILDIATLNNDGEGLGFFELKDGYYAPCDFHCSIRIAYGILTRAEQKAGKQPKFPLANIIPSNRIVIAGTLYGTSIHVDSIETKLDTNSILSAREAQTAFRVLHQKKLFLRNKNQHVQDYIPLTVVDIQQLIQDSAMYYFEPNYHDYNNSPRYAGQVQLPSAVFHQNNIPSRDQSSNNQTPQLKYNTFIKRGMSWYRYECVTGHFFKYDRQHDRVSEYDENGSEVVVNPSPKESNPVNINGPQLQ